MAFLSLVYAVRGLVTIPFELVSYPFSKCLLVCGMKRDLEKLKIKFSAINAVRLDAEKKQLDSDAVRDWLEGLKEVAYDVDDVLDLVSTEGLRRRVEINGSMIGEVSDLLSPRYRLGFRFKIGNKIKGILERLEDIECETKRFPLNMPSIDMPVERIQRQTISDLDEPVVPVYGREHDTETIVNRLLRSSNNDDEEKLGVISIVGRGGIGKTTLAQLVYNDERVVDSFKLRMWVRVSQDFDLQGLVKAIIESATNAPCPDFESLADQKSCLYDALNATKFLLVLDDVWNEDATKWEELKIALMGGASGSMIIVTTRSFIVAEIMDTIPPYHLSFLSKDHCLAILMDIAFQGRHGEENPEFLEIGRAIARKCGGNPLAAKALGAALCFNPAVAVWKYVRDSVIWELESVTDVLWPLRLSCELLPSYLKRCFAYCSVFPKGYEIGRVSLINHWMAQGFLRSPNKSLDLEDVGNQYFNELIFACFLKPASEMFDSEIYKCEMHDLIHDLAREVASSEWFEVNFKLKRISQRVRHVSFVSSENEFPPSLHGEEFPPSLHGEEFPPSLLDAKKLRTFRFSYEVGPIKKSFVEKLIFHFRRLRVLDLTDSQFEELPSFVSKLKQLRFLRLSWNRQLKVLPNSICKLLNLQSLYLLDCKELQDLPRDIGKLVSLRHFYLTTKLSCMPGKGLKGLTSLRSLVLSKCENLDSLSEGIQYLTSLRTLRISQCPKLASLPSEMKYLTALEKLEIWECQELNLSEGEDLQGLRKLQSLAIRKLPELKALPQGLKDSAASLKYLLIENCTALTSLLPERLNDLTSLRRLHITNCTSLTSLPDRMDCLTELQQLRITGCPPLSRPEITHVCEIYIDSVKIK